MTTKHPSQELPIRSKLEMLDDEDLWKRVEVGARFFVSHSPHSYRLNTAENIIRVGRLSVAGWQDDLVAQEFGVGRIVVRQSRKILHRVMDWTLTDHEKAQVGLKTQETGIQDRLILNRMKYYGPLYRTLMSARDLSQQAQDHPDLIEVIKRISQGHSIFDITFNYYGLGGYFSKEASFAVENSFANFFMPGRVNQRRNYYLDRHFFQKLALSRLFSSEQVNGRINPLAQIAKANNAIRRLIDIETGRNTRQLSATKNFVLNLPHIQKLMDGTGYEEIADIHAYLASYESLNILPSPISYVLEELLLGQNTGEIARKIHGYGVAISADTLLTQITSLGRFIENALMDKHKGRISKEGFVREMSRNRKKEIQTLLKQLAIKQKQAN